MASAMGVSLVVFAVVPLPGDPTLSIAPDKASHKEK
jgi:hypothetical protein